MENRKNIAPIIEAIILCGRKNIVLSDHRDSGKVLTCSESEIINKGNFREVFRYIAQGNNDLKLYLKGPETIKYTSATSQNAIIEACKL